MNELLSHNSKQQQQPNLNQNILTPNKNRDQYHGGIGNRTVTLTTPSPSARYPNMANMFQHMSHSTLETTNTYSRNGHFTNCTYLRTQNRRHTYHTTPFRLPGTVCEQQGFYHRGSPRSNNWFYSTFLRDYYNSFFHNTKITASNQETSPHARSTIYEGYLLSSIMIDQTIIQAAPLPIETFDGTQSKFKASTESIENAVQILSQTQYVKLSPN